MQNPDDGTEGHHVENPDDGTERKMAIVHHAHCGKKNGRGKSRKMAAVIMENVLVKSSPFRMNKWASTVQPISNCLQTSASLRGGEQRADRGGLCTKDI